MNRFRLGGVILGVILGTTLGTVAIAAPHGGHGEAEPTRFQAIDQPLPLKLGVAGLGLGLIVAELSWFWPRRRN
ncbi:MAG: hypothetical protein OHK0012_20100 [Synechococcales cyanobacterium]